MRLMMNDSIVVGPEVLVVIWWLLIQRAYLRVLRPGSQGLRGR